MSNYTTAAGSLLLLCASLVWSTDADAQSGQNRIKPRIERLLQRNYSLPKSADFSIFVIDRFKESDTLLNLEAVLLYSRLNYGMKDLSRLRKINFYEHTQKIRFRLDEEGFLTLSIPLDLPWKAWIAAFTRSPFSNEVFLEYANETGLDFLDELMDDHDYQLAQELRYSQEEGLHQFVDPSWTNAIQILQQTLCSPAPLSELETSEAFQAAMEELLPPIKRVSSHDRPSGESLNLQMENFQIHAYRSLSRYRQAPTRVLYIDRLSSTSIIPRPQYLFSINEDCEIQRSEYFFYDQNQQITHREWRDAQFRMVRRVEANEKPLKLQEIYENIPTHMRLPRPLDEIFDVADRTDREIITLLDTGIDYNHPLIAYKIFRDKNDNVIGLDLEERDGRPYDFKDSLLDHDRYFDHGTHVGGIIVDDTDDLMILPLRYSTKPETFEEGIHFAFDQGSRIVNISLGSKNYELWRYLDKAIQELPEMLFVVAAGNDGVDLKNSPRYPANLNYPNVITVAATDELNQLTSFSNFSVDFVTLAAPGKNILSLTPEFGRSAYSGTSMSSPRVARAAGLIRFQFPHLSAPEIKSVLCGSVDKTLELEEKTKCGGSLNLQNALSAAKQEDLPLLASRYR